MEQQNCSISIEGNRLTYTISNEYSRIYSPWQIDINEIVVVGFINMMKGDDDSDFLVFIDRSGQQSLINLGIPTDNIKKVIASINEKYDLNIGCEIFTPQDKEIILYPKELHRKRIYKKTTFYSIKKSLGVLNPESCTFSEEVLGLLERNEV